MASIKNVDIRRGMVLVGEDGQLHQCLDRDLNTPGNWRAILQLKMRNLKTGSITINRVRPEDKAELAYLEKRQFQYSYKDGSDYIFVDSETFEQMAMPDEIIGDQMKYLKENDTVVLTMYEGKPIDVELPATVELKVIETEPGIKGAHRRGPIQARGSGDRPEDHRAAVHQPGRNPPSRYAHGRVP